MLRAITSITTALACVTFGAMAQDKPKDTPKMKDLTGVEELKTQFNADKGKRRLLLLLSPT